MLTEDAENELGISPYCFLLCSSLLHRCRSHIHAGGRRCACPERKLVPQSTRRQQDLWLHEPGSMSWREGRRRWLLHSNFARRCNFGCTRVQWRCAPSEILSLSEATATAAERRPYVGSAIGRTILIIDARRSCCRVSYEPCCRSLTITSVCSRRRLQRLITWDHLVAPRTPQEPFSGRT